MASLDKGNGTGIAALLAAADQALLRDEVAAARTHASEVLRLTDARADGLEHARARLRLARCDIAVGRIERALVAATQAAAAFRAHDERIEETAALALASRAATRAGRIVEAVETALLAVALGEALPATGASAQAACALGAALAAGHHFAAAERALRSAAELAQRCDDRAALVDAVIESTLARLVRHALARLEGEPDPQPLLDALERCRELEVVGAAAAPTTARALASAIALAACLTGDVDDARRHLGAHGEPMRAGIAPHWSGALDAWTRLELAWFTQDAHDAVMHAAQIAAVAEAAQHAPLRSLGHLLAADLHESRGDVASALIEWKAGLRHDRVNRTRDIDSRTPAAGALLAARRQQLEVATLAARAARLQKLASEDALTGVANLRRFEQCLADALVASADAGARLCVALVDCSDLGGADSPFGQALGDDALRAVAALLARGVREGDVVARLGGDEFAIVFRDAGIEVARDACERIAATVAAQDWHALRPGLRIVASIGVEQALAGDTLRMLLARADRALFEQKLQRDAAPVPTSHPGDLQDAGALAQVGHWLAQARQVVVFANGGDASSDATPRGPEAGPLPADDDVEGRAAFDAAWGERRRTAAAAVPGVARQALAAFARGLAAHAVETTFVTEDVDGLLARAGAADVIELRGNLLRERCRACGAPSVGTADDGCPTCGRPAPAFRPDLVLAGEAPDARLAAGAELAAKGADLVFVVGADPQAFPGAVLLGKARRRGARIVVLGAARAALADAAFIGPVPALLEALLGRLEAARSTLRDPG